MTEFYGQNQTILPPEQQEARNRLFCRALENVGVVKPQMKLANTVQIPRDSNTNRLSDAT